MAALEINSYVLHHRLVLKLRPILVGELYLAKKLNYPVYIFRNESFVEVIKEGSIPTKDQIQALIKAQYREVFVYPEDVLEIKKNLESALVKVTRSLSVGDPLDNGTKEMKLLSLNLGGLYKNPHSDEHLMLQFQSSQNLSKFLKDNRKLHAQFYSGLRHENFHYTITQPMLSSLMLQSFLQSIHLFHDKEVENLFLASYLKDLGIALIPEEKYDQRSLTTREEELFAGHADFSFDLLEGRIPLSKNYLTIVKHHHFLNDRLKDIVSKDRHGRMRDPEVILGIESTLVCVFDMIVAMTSDRPYRKPMTVFQSLELIKLMMADDYPQEFRAIVVFLKQFFKN
jgi:hypothetical protein